MRWVDVLETASFVCLVLLVGYAIKAGALKDNNLAVVLVVLGLLSPSPYRVAIRLKDWLEMRRNGDGGSTKLNPNANDSTVENTVMGEN